MIKNVFEHILDFLSEFFSKEEVWVLLLFVGLGVWIIAAFFDTAWEIIKNFFLYAWPIILFFILLPILTSLWLFVRQERFKNNIEFVLLELKIPREVKKSPQGMEEVLGTIHSLRNAPDNFEEKYWDGEVTRSFSLEMVSFGGETRFFIRVFAKQRHVVEAALYSYYPDLEVVEAEDYISQLPRNTEELAERNMDVWGTEMILAQEAAYPIKTYDRYENIAEEKQFDPISTFLEVLGKVRKNEVVAIQILIAPASLEWKDEFEEFLDELKKPKTLTMGEGEEEQEMTVARSPGHIDVLKAVEENLSKPAFHTLIRLLYLAPKDLFTDMIPRGAVGAFNQFTTLNLNSFKRNKPITTLIKIWTWPHLFSSVRLGYRKQRILWNYRKREVPPETWMGKLVTSFLYNSNFGSTRFFMTTKGIATLFHPPTFVVLTAPHIRRVESRRTGPPAGLAIFGEEGDIERFT